ncbi:cytochrome c oxidase assembly factor 1 homolog [Cololabis saira]|uniref:cytochrome c oxidase assembly factor 1 homolog n=1 Tax=Cololabis saira TaxID=129043 RepID=UPI002AD4448F|nr:cytochrome c oxidase assembly factor 1 homolog [Cololabis saira]
MYYLMQRRFAGSQYHRLAVQQLQDCPPALAALGAPPLTVHNIHLSDRTNRMDQHSAQVKIPVTGPKSGGYLYAFAVRDGETGGWRLQQAVLALRQGQNLDLLDPQTRAGGALDLLDP